MTSRFRSNRVFIIACIAVLILVTVGIVLTVVLLSNYQAPEDVTDVKNVVGDSGSQSGDNKPTTTRPKTIEPVTETTKTNGGPQSTKPTTTSPPTTNPPTTDPPTTEELELQRIDCFPEYMGNYTLVTQEKCVQRGCAFQQATDTDVPRCYFGKRDNGFRVTDRQNTGLGFQLTLKQQGSLPYGGKIDSVVFRVEERGDKLLRFTFADPNNERYEVPVPIDLPNQRAGNPNYEVRVTNENPFSFQVIRKSTRTVLFDTSVGGLIFSDQFLQIATKLPSKNIYGFGENLHQSFRHDLNHKQWPLFSRDQPPKWTPQSSLYGVHPFYQCVEKDGNTHGVFIRNSNAQEYGFTPLPMLTYRTVGGILDFYLFTGPTPEDVVIQYTQVVGRPIMPPYWALGFQLCRYGYNSLENLQAAVERTKAADIPHDVQYADIDHMHEQMDFTIDNVSFAGLPDYFRELQSNGMKTIIILDPTLNSNVSGYEPYERMKAIDGNIKWPEDFQPPPDSSDSNGAVLGYVWPLDKVVFPDFFKSSTNAVWKELIVKHHKELPFDGLWIDMNEPANFGTNLDKPWNWPENWPDWSLKCQGNDLDQPPYRPMAAFVHDNRDSDSFDMAVDGVPLADKTICMNTVQGEGGKYNHYDVHSLYGWSQTESTLEAVKEATGKRSMVISRSTFAGSGKYAGHWLGDNESSWPDLHHSIIGMLEFNLFGIPYIGADICGFFNNRTDEMCKRWMQLGAFYTFARNHNGKGYLNQDPGSLSDDVIRASREALTTRYWLLPYLYTLFHNAHVHGHTVIRPLHHEFPRDDIALGVDTQFLWGPALLISPILMENQTSLRLYLPEGRWYNYYTGVLDNEDEGQMLELPVTPEDQIPLHVRGGYILPMQHPANNTFYSRKNPLALLVALNRDSSAQGEIMWDDGEEIGTYESGNNFYATFMARRDSVQMNRVWRMNVPEIDNLHFNMIKVYGVSEQVAYIHINNDMTPHDNFTYDPDTHVLLIEGLELSMAESFMVKWEFGDRVVASEAMRVDCLPDIPNLDKRLVSMETCMERGCLWSPVEEQQVPPCYFDRLSYGYSVVNREMTASRLTYRLSKMGNASIFGEDMADIILTVNMHSDQLLQFTFDVVDQSERYKVPIDLNLPMEMIEDPKYEFVENTEPGPFSFKIIRKSSRTVIWDSSVGGLTFADQFLQIATRLPSRNLYGLGENRHDSFRHDLFYKRWGAFSRDQAPGWGDNTNLYGVHPFYTCVEDENNAHGVLLLNSNAQDFSLSPLPMLTYRTIGGVLDFYVFMGPHPENVVQQYTQLIGRPMMPPYWSLGFQLCRYGYNSIENLRNAVDRTITANIPLDVQYADIDHMEERKDFTIDDVNFNGLNTYFKNLQQNGMRIIIILDPALISNETNYEPYELMAAADANIRWPPMNEFKPPVNSSDNGTVLGYVWPKGKTVFPDFFKNETREIWKNLIKSHHQNQLTFDGLWIDMNEPANFGTNEDRPFNWPEKDIPYWSLKCAGNKWDEPPYKTMATYIHDNPNRNATLADKTVCLNSVQGPSGMYRHYDVHSLYGWSQSPPTLEAIQQTTGERGIVISRSTFPGSGKYAGHWLGDNDSSWKHLRDSVIGILEFNLFGIPYIGADICGFFSDVTDELCLRWMQLGAFYTFFRNHNGLNNRDQDPASFNDVVTEATRTAVETRYWLLPYLYTLFHYAHVKGNTVIRPLHHEFIWDSETYRIDSQFLWGPALLISPILEQGQEKLSLYLPIKSRWYDFYTGEMRSAWGGHSVDMEVSLDTKIPLHLRGGYILPLQQPANNTHYSRQRPFTLRVALDKWSSEGGQAEGELFWDDGVNIDLMADYYFTKFMATEMSVEMKIQQNSSQADTLYINTIEIYGVDRQVDNIYYTVHSAMDSDMMQSQMKHEEFNYDPYRKVLQITNLRLLLTENFSIKWWNRDKPSMDEMMRIDCLPDSHLVENHREECSRRGCLWRDDTSAREVPACFIDKDQYGYRLRNMQTMTDNQILFALNKANADASMFGGDAEVILLTVDMLSDSLLRLKFTDPGDPNRYEVPVPINLPQDPPTENRLYDFSYDSENIFTIKVMRRSTNTTLFDTSLGGLTFASQFLQLVTKLPSHNVYGFGENRHFSFRHNMYYKEWPMFARDQGVAHNDYGNLYGVHPFFMCLEDKQGNTFGVFLRNSNAQEVSLMPTPAVNYRTTGGILDFFIFLGPSPESVIQQYTELIGRPYFPPYWSLGFQLCRYGYNHLDNLKAAYQRTVDAGIPLDIQYADIDHMDERMDFTYDRVNFDGLPEFIRSVQTDGTKFIIILDPALISNVTGYQPYEKGLQRDVFVKWPVGLSPDYNTYNNDNMLGYVWPKGKTVFPDFLNPATSTYWQELIVDWHQTIPFDGLWIDMNEPANFETNNERPQNWPAKDKPYWTLKCAANDWDDPPYKPRSITGDRLSDKTLCMIGVQRTNEEIYRHYDVHSLYGWSQMKPTLDGLRAATSKRGIVISRSTFPGSGANGGHWLGDNDSEWPQLKDSIVGMLEFNMFGIPYVGADICGFGKDTTKEMCQRWMQLGAFYPFSRNHNAIGQKDQDPAVLGAEVADASRRVMNIRYFLLPYLYTLFYEAHQTGSTVVRSLMQQYPEDANTWSIDTQFLWGADFMVVPVLNEGALTRTVYFPHDIWYDYHTGAAVWARGQYDTVDAPMDHIPLYIRGGAIIAGQPPGKNTQQSRQNPMHLIVASAENGTESSGRLFVDDGDSQDTIESSTYLLMHFSYRNLTSQSGEQYMDLGSTIDNNMLSTPLTWEKVTILGFPFPPSSIRRQDSELPTSSYMYYPATKKLLIDGLSVPISDALTIQIY